MSIMDMDICSDASSEDQILCAKCSAINAEALMSAHGYLHSRSRTELAETIGLCHLCNVLSQNIDPGPFSEFHAQYFHNYQNLHLGASFMDSNSPHLGKVITATIDTDTVGILTRPIQELEVWTSAGDPAAKLGIPLMNLDLTNTRSPQTFNFIRSCLEECKAHSCRSPLSQQSAGSAPSRLLEVGENSLSLSDVGRTCPTYIALSHCWGTNLSKYMTTRANLSNKKAAIDWQDLTPTFRDAIEITRRLGIRYIWIDALCIIQDSREDWASESIKMGDIYHNAFVTISATHARDGFGGCFNKQSTVGLGENCFTISNRNNKMGLNSTIMLTSKQRTHAPRIVESSPINSRGWVYQERILSPRILHFASTQLVRECRKTYRLESLKPMDLPTIPSRILRPETLDAAELIERWHNEIVAIYCKREFTKYEDRLVALAGIAQIYQLHIKDEYIAGLWKSHVAYGLCWRHERRPKTEYLKGHRYPSWTWASHDGDISWRPSSHFSPDSGFSLVSTHLEFEKTARQEFSPVKGGYMAVMGRVLPITRIDSQSPSAFGDVKFELGQVKGIFFPDYNNKMHEISSRAHETVALVLGHTPNLDAKSTLVLVLAPAPRGRGGYVRLGDGLCHFSSADLLPFWHGRKPQRLVLY